MKLLLVLFLTIQACSAKDTVPVFIMDHGKAMSPITIEPNPLVKIKSDTFSQIANEAMVKAECVIIFVEENLCTEDITTKDKNGSPFPNLQLELLKKNVAYLPAVVHPYKSLSLIFKLMPFNVFHLSPGDKLLLKDNYYKYMYIIFRDGKQNETRTEILRKHDALMKEVYTTVKATKRVVAIYTGKLNPVVVEKMMNVPVKAPKGAGSAAVFVASENALFRFTGVYAATSMRRSTLHQLPMVAEETYTRRKLSTTMAYNDFELQFNFGFGETQWTLDTVVLLEGGEEVGRRMMGVGAPWNWSFVCGEPLTIVNNRDGSVVTISRYQIQPLYPKLLRRSWNLKIDNADISASAESPTTIDYRKNNRNIPNGKNFRKGHLRQDPDPPSEPTPEETSSEEPISSPEKTEPSEASNDPSKTCFGESVNCEPYFNAAILSALFVSFLLLGVLSCGITMLYNCRSNDRYDDPHGKEVITTSGEDK